MAARDEIIEFFDELLDPGSFEDYGPNGLQVPGAQEVELIATAVSANRETLTRAIEAGAGMIVCHHGLFWNGMPREITPTLRGRLKPLFDAEASLAAYHLPLDAHAEVGNNALLCRALGLEPAEPFASHRGRPVGWVGRGGPTPIEELLGRLAQTLGREPLLQGAGPAEVGSVGVVSGGAPEHLRDAIAAGLDAFVTGEPAEWAMAEADEAGIHFIAAGHYATEVLGVRELGERARARFGVEHVFVDVPNPV